MVDHHHELYQYCFNFNYIECIFGDLLFNTSNAFENTNRRFDMILYVNHYHEDSSSTSTSPRRKYNTVPTQYSTYHIPHPTPTTEIGYGIGRLNNALELFNGIMINVFDFGMYIYYILKYSFLLLLNMLEKEDVLFLLIF